ncbi:MAG: hypothetical protein KAG89_20760 [Fulvimarina manganoxydans]|uniref:hypothetical protein n=1 Tax=Fulvimarina manganoxydans TaxID=937218 RepID=UPI0023539447|nr:hypothetical protein [Fulvimarina manganoxydans]MCK5934579.1 hypothetical protein [Fulvimarina manganoxydans]
MATISLTITVRDEYVRSTPLIANQLAQRGLQIDHVAAPIGSIFGSADDVARGTFETVEGVQDVRESLSLEDDPQTVRESYGLHLPIVDRQALMDRSLTDAASADASSTDPKSDER